MRGAKKEKEMFRAFGCQGTSSPLRLFSFFCTCCSITHSLSVGSQSIECMLSRERVFRVCVRAHMGIGEKEKEP